MTAPDLVVWDFDGVLNHEPPTGPFPWVDDLETDLGIPPAAFRAFLSRPGLAEAALTGAVDPVDELDAWLAAEGHGLSGEAFFSHWLAADARPDAETIGWLERSGPRAVIGTNNPVRRADDIMHWMGFARRVEKMFASGALGVAKPDAGFFRAIEDWAQLRPDRILLIDDTEANVDAAARRGWRVFHFTPHSRAELPRRIGLG
ncbi:Phosphoglycolate phosphatase [Roseivivax jejudonensis]|uniref:Phosphoglycolate phosphatase n=1 Tax=Roseivivax jejudonensis TaxID=1529041 RepID=A0A1X6ZMC2_9RHOB|nr:HAD-IA family hydrolase [Roseivivax jejudonensis]SLN55548.1 Phosphoglycolate phosphatase [Roseivivax jejudonensis]